MPIRFGETHCSLKLPTAGPSRACVQQQLDRVQAAMLGSSLQRSSSVAVSTSGIHVSAILDQCLHNSGVSSDGGKLERCRTTISRRSGVDSASITGDKMINQGRRSDLTRSLESRLLT